MEILQTKSIRELREKIDEIDENIIDLLEERVDVARIIIEKKRSNGNSKYSAGREKELITNLCEYSNLPKRFIVKIYGEVLDMVKTVVK